MEFNEKLFENIVVAGNSTGITTIFDDIADAEERLNEYGDLYDAFDKIKKVLEGPSRYNEIQTVAPAIDVNQGVILIKGMTKHSVKADNDDSSVVDDVKSDTSSDGIVKEYANELEKVIPDTLKLELNISDEVVADKVPFEILISRKG